MVLHALLEHAELPGLADDEVGPLHDHDGDEEGGVASVLQLLPVSIGPLLPIRVLQIVHCLGVPRSPQAKKVAWPESVLTEDNEVDKEAWLYVLVLIIKSTQTLPADAWIIPICP